MDKEQALFFWMTWSVRGQRSVLDSVVTKDGTPTTVSTRRMLESCVIQVSKSSNTGDLIVSLTITRHRERIFDSD